MRLTDQLGIKAYSCRSEVRLESLRAGPGRSNHAPTANQTRPRLLGLGRLAQLTVPSLEPSHRITAKLMSVPSDLRPVEAISCRRRRTHHCW